MSTTHAIRSSTAPLAAGSVAALAPLTAAGALLVAYPALRPYSSEVGAAGARAFASWQWTAAHLCAVLAFVALAQALPRIGLGPGPVARVAARATSLGAVLVLPYYGAEVFGVGAVGRWAAADGSPAQADRLVEGIRFSVPAMVLFALGLVLLAVGGACLARTVWVLGGPAARVAALALALGFVLYLPQFWFAPDLRVAHGALLCLGLVVAGARIDAARAQD